MHATKPRSYNVKAQRTKNIVAIHAVWAFYASMRLRNTLEMRTQQVCDDAIWAALKYNIKMRSGGFYEAFCIHILR